MAKKFFGIKWPGRKAPQDKSVGHSGARVINGYPENKEKYPGLSPENRFSSYANLLNKVPMVSASVNYYIALIGSATWAAEPADQSEKSLEVAEFLDRNIKTVEGSWSKIVKKIAMFKFHGFSVLERTMELRSDGFLYLKSLEDRPQGTIKRFDLDDSGQLLGVVQSIDAKQDVYLPRGKILYIVEDLFDPSPQGSGLFRQIYAIGQKWIEVDAIETMKLQVDLRGIPIGRAPYSELEEQVSNEDISPEDMKEIIRPIESFVGNIIRKEANMALMLDSKVVSGETENGEILSSTPAFDIKLLQGSTQGLEDLDRILNRLDRQIGFITGAEGLILGKSGGSESLAKDKSKELSLRVDQALDEIAEAIHRDVIEPLMRENGIDKKNWPKLLPSKMRYQDIESVTGALKDISDAGLSEDDLAVNRLRRMMGLPDQPDVMTSRDASLDGDLDQEE